MTSLSKLFLLTASLSVLGLASCAKKDTPKTDAPETVKAKNVILFIGDGMGISTITAARIYDGQSKGMNGEDNKLSFEEFPNLSLVKTYNLDAQVPDSAGTASAMNTGMKTEIGKINVQPGGHYATCETGGGTAPVLMADLAERAGMSTGIVSTARLTHATPAAVYGHSFSRGWEHDTSMGKEGGENGCTDLATQLINYSAGDGIDIALGGGRGGFLTTEAGGRRKDGVDLTAAWDAKSDSHIYTGDVKSLRALTPSGKQNVLGIFNGSHLSYEADRDDSEEPSLTELTEFAIKNLDARDTGYFLMVEAGRIDHAHHGTNAYRALTETQELARAVALADKLTNDDDTLILVTADHSHVFTIAGYPKIGNPILGLVVPPSAEVGEYSKAADGLPYTTLGYHNGQNPRSDVEQTDEMVQDKDYHQQSAIQRASETHGGEDVALFAKGPGADAVHGVIDQAEIFGIMTDALGIKTD